MAITYNPVALPAIGGSTQSQGQANSNVTTGLNELGTKITGLGDRRQKRLDDEVNRKNERGLEILKLAAANVDSEEELDQIAGQLGLLPGGSVKDAVVIPGAAGVLNTNRTRIIENSESRGDARQSLARAGQEELTLTDSTRESDAAVNLADANKTYASRIAEVQALSFSNDPRYKDAAMSLNNDMAASHGITMNDIFSQAETNRTLTDASDTTLSTNSLLRTENETSAQASVGQRGVNAAIQARQKNAAEIGLTTDNQAFSDGQISREAAQFTSDLLINGFSDARNIQAMRDSDFDDATKVSMIAAYKAGSLDQFNPVQDETIALDPAGKELTQVANVARTISNMLFDTNLPTNQADQLPVNRMADGIIGMVRTQIDGDPDIGTYARAQEFANSPDFELIGDAGLYAQKLYPDLDWEQNQLDLISSIRNRPGLNLTTAEVMVLVGDTIANQGMFFNSPELADQRFIKRAEAYSKGKAAVERQYNALKTDETNAVTLQSRINEKRRDLERVKQSPEYKSGDRKTYNKISDEIRTMAQTMAGIEDELDRRGSRSTDVRPEKKKQPLRGSITYSEN